MSLFHQLAVAVLLVLLTLWLQCAGVAAVIEWLRRVATRDISTLGPIRTAGLVVQSSIAIIVLHGVVILLWAGFYREECFPSWELSFYYSASSYSTVGYGDLVFPTNWRLLGPLESMTGVLMCGVSVCVLFALVTRLIPQALHSEAENKHPVVSASSQSGTSQGFREQSDSGVGRVAIGG
jgi:voltage-gated potassium channel